MAKLGTAKHPAVLRVQTQERAALEMATPLLRTKLYIPPARPDLIARPHLLQRLDEGLCRGHKLTLLSTPAGFGKTTLLSTWVASLAHEIAWLSLDRDDNAPTRFFAYMIAALQQRCPAIAQDVQEALVAAPAALSSAPGTGAMLGWLASTINQIDALESPIVLVLDDYHLIAAPQIHQALAYLLDHMPRNLHLAIASRSDPPLPLARLRGRGQLTELRQADLSLSVAEVGALFKQIGQDLAPGDVAELAARTEGWGTALQVASLAVRGMDQARASAFLKAFSGRHEHIADYFVDEVLSRQPERVRAFLLQTSILDRLTDSLSDALCGQTDSRHLIDRLEADNLFIVPLDNEQHWYRYHRLFADWLRLHLRQEQPALVPQLHRRASEWYERQTLIGPAIAHAIQASDMERVADLLETYGAALWGNGESALIARGLAALPRALLHARPRLCIYGALLALTSGHTEQAESLLQTAERSPGSPALDRSEIDGMIAALRAYIAFVQGHAPAIIQHAQRALHCLSAENEIWRAGAAMALGDAHISFGNALAAAQAYRQAIHAAQASGNTYLTRTATLKRLDARRLQGKLHQVATSCRQQLQATSGAGSGSVPLFRNSAFGALLGSVLIEWNELDEALHHLRASVELARQHQHAIQLGWAYDLFLRALFARRDWDAMQETFSDIDRLAMAADVPAWAANRLAAWRARMWIARASERPGGLTDADRLLHARGIGENDAAGYMREQEHLALIRLRFAQGEPAAVAGLVDKLLLAAQAGGRQAQAIEILLLQALSRQAQSQLGQAVAVLDQALHTAEPEGYVRLFVDEGQPMARLLYLAAQKGVAPAYCGRLLAALAEDQPDSASSIPAQDLVEPLSDRELQVLALLAEGLSNREIAARLVISLSTVKGHTAGIYGKLAVHNRTRAVAKAQTLGILPSLSTHA